MYIYTKSKNRHGAHINIRYIDLETRGKIEHFIIVRKSIFRGLDSPNWFLP